MGADEAERLLRRVVNGEPMGRRLPRQRVPAEVRVPAGAGEAAASGAGDVPATTGGPRLRTVTEETFRHTVGVRRRWPWLVAAAVVVLAVPATVILLDRRDPGGVVGAPVTRSPTVALTAAMGVQACAAQDSDAGEPVVTGPTALPGAGQMMGGWVFYNDHAGFHIAVGKGWLMTRVDGIACFQDPTSPRLIAVYEVGRVPGHPKDILVDTERTWTGAAKMTAYERVDLRDLFMDEGGADLEYAYDDPDGLRMHGVNRMVRIQGRVFLIFWLTTQTSWLADRTLLNMVQPSFGVES
jgi:hypothetical protein